MTLRPFEHLMATSLKQASALLAKYRKKAAIIGGGTDLLGVLKDSVRPSNPEMLVDIKPITELRFVIENKKGLHIGAQTTLSEVAGSKAVKERAPLLSQAARVVASWQIRNMGTVGGNICQEPRCWYYRTPSNLFHCLRKGGEKCNAILGENRYHSIFGSSRPSLPACSANCRANVAIPAYLSKIRRGELFQATRLLLERNPLPAITGRVCPHLCEQNCNRRELDEAVSTRAIERHLGDHVLANAGKFMKKPRLQTKKRVAVVGSGPAGLAAAYYLRQAGHEVSVFDRMPEAGGMLRYCIPPYRLPKDIVSRQIQALERTGIKFELNVDIGGGKVTLKHLRKDYDSVFLATGGWRQKTLRMEHEELLMPGLDFLIDIQRGRRQAPGKKVLVIGGGNVAVDVALSALRLGSADVTMACLEAREVMPAFPEETAQALEEGVRLLPSWGPHRILMHEGKISGMELVRCTSVFDAKGQFRPTFDPATKMTVAADQILVAIGQGSDLAFVGRSLKTERGLIVAQEETQATNLPGVYAGGDVVGGAASVIEAIAAGRRAALAIDSALRSKVKAPSQEPLAGESFVELNVDALSRMERAKVRGRAVSARTIEAEDVSTLNLRAVETEARRCINCACVAVNASDLAPALLALNAKIKTTKRAIAAEDFFAAGLMSTTALDPDELVTEIEVPAPRPGSVQSYLKFRIRNAIDFPIVGVASVFTMKDGKVASARVALGAVSSVPLRAREVEKFLTGKAPNEETAEVAGLLAVKGVMPLARNKFKIQIIKTLLRKAILDAAGQR